MAGCLFASFPLQEGVSLEVEDGNGNTPLQLSRGREHREISTYLEGALLQASRRFPCFEWRWD